MSQRQTFDHTTESVSQARRFVSRAIEGVAPDVIESVVLMASELASNCIRHTNSQFEVTVTRTGREIRVAATDRGEGEPVIRDPAPSDPSGRGLQIVDLLAADWGVERLPNRGKTVWFTVQVPARERAPQRCAV